jgi:hypothetical protein
MSRSRRFAWLRVAAILLLAVAAATTPRTASAWHGRWRGFGWGCGPGFGARFAPGFYGGLGFGGWGFGGSRFFASESVYLGGPFGGFFSGGIRSTVIGVPFWGRPWAFGGYGYPCTYLPYACGPYAWGGVPYSSFGYPGGWYGCGYAPVVVSPFPGAIAPVYGPAGIRPFLGVSATPPGAAVQAITANGAAVNGAAAGVARPAARPVAVEPAAAIVRASNGEARLRAGKLVAIGDRHLRAAVADRGKLTAALDAYRRAAAIAPDQADTHLRQAIVLYAQGRDEAAEKSVARAVSLDARLGVDPAAALAARRRLPPDPVFGERPDAGPTSLAARTSGILARVFREADAGPVAVAGGNWIADLWLRRFTDPAGAMPAAVAAR